MSAHYRWAVPRTLRASVFNFCTGLLGGATYYARTMHRQETGAVAYTVASRKIQIIPA